jgi:Tol biopolymer transport system component
MRPDRLPFLGALALLVGWAAPLAAQPPARLAVPDREAQARAEALVKRILAEEYARAAKEPEARAKLVRTLWEQGKETRDDDALRFVLLREARDLAARSADAPVVLRIVGDLARDFAVDGPALKVEALLRTQGAASTPQANRTLAQAALGLLGDLLDADAPALAARLAPVAEGAAGKAGDDALRAEARSRGGEARLLAAERARIQEAIERLRTAPDDARANRDVGRYHALARGDWARALPLLARGADADLRDAARRDLARPADATGQVEAAEAWRRLAQGAPRARAHVLLRAASWYQQASLTLQGDEGERVEGRLKEIAASLPDGFHVPALYAFARRLEGHRGNVTGVAFAPDGQRLLTSAADRTVRLWGVETGKPRRLGAHESWARGVALAPDGRTALSWGDDNTLRLWDTAAGRELRQIKGHAEWVRCAAFLPDGRRVVSGSDDGTVRLWDAGTGAELRRFEGHKGYVLGLAVSPDGRRLLTAGTDESVRLWDIETGKPLRRLDGHAGNVNAVAFSPDGRRALSAGVDGTVRLWDLESGKEVRRLVGHKGTVWCVAFSPDGKLALSGGSDRTARLWDMASGRELRRLRGHTSFVLSAAFSPDGRSLATGSADKTVRLWAEAGR